MKRRSPRIITRVVVFLLLGAIVNVAVAWGCALWIDALPLSRAPFASGFSVMAPRWDIEPLFIRPGSAAIGFDSFTVMTRRPAPPPDANIAEVNEWVRAAEAWARGELVPRPPVENPTIIAPPRWSASARPPTAAEIDKIHYWEEARGWPMLALLSREVTLRDVAARKVIEKQREWAIEVGGVQGPLGLPRVLPLHPIWPGFAINTIFYAAILWLLFGAPFALRRHVRIKRGLCPACGYPVGESPVCTECGKPVEVRSVEPVT